MFIAPAPAYGPSRKTLMLRVVEPALVVTIELVPLSDSASVAVTLVVVPTTVCVVKLTVAIPLLLVLLVPDANDPLASDLLQVTTLFAVLTALL